MSLNVNYDRYYVIYISNVFILLLLCPNIILYLLSIIVTTSVSLWYYPFIIQVQPILISVIVSVNASNTNIDCPYSYPSLYHSFCPLLAYILYLNSLVLYLSGLLVSIICCIYYIRDGIREYTSTYISCIIVVSVSLLGILVSEWILFASYFVTNLSSTCSYNTSLEAIYTSDPIYVTYSNTIILTHVAISLSSIIVIRDVYRLHILLTLYAWIIILTFLHIQIKEFLAIPIYNNDSIYVSMFFSLLGLHLFHILIGLVLISLICWTSSYNRYILTFITIILVVTHHQLTYTLQLVYWHFVDLLWLIIYYLLYN
jgi:heme/copper-type cytochrome/quinol oxidase subunit 3